MLRCCTSVVQNHRQVGRSSPSVVAVEERRPRCTSQRRLGHLPLHRERQGSATDSRITIRYDTIRDAILTCARKPTRVSLIYRTEPTTKMCETTRTHTHKHTHPFNGPFSVTTRVNRYQKAKTNLDFTEARDSEWQLHQWCYMQVCTSLQTENRKQKKIKIKNGYDPPVCSSTSLDSAGCSCECRVASSHRRCCDCTASSAPRLQNISTLDSTKLHCRYTVYMFDLCRQIS